MNDLRAVLMQDGGITMYIVFFSLLLIYFTVICVWDYRDTKKKKDLAVTENEKCKGYGQSIMALWGATLAVFIMCFIGGIGLEEIGFRQISFNYGFWFTAVTLSISGLFFAYLLYALISLLVPKFRESQSKQAVGGVTKYLPRSKKAKWLFSLLALSAGVCEEIIFRGFFLFLFFAIFPNAPVYLVVLIPILLFGIGHAYQGLQGIMGTALLGAFFICLYLVTDSLIFPILLHFLNDLIGAFMVSDEDINTTE